MTAAPMVVLQRESLQLLKEAFARAAARARDREAPALVSVSSVAPVFDPVTVYESARERGLDAVFWHVPWQDTALVGVGAAWTVTAEGPGRFEQVSSRWRALSENALHVVVDPRGTGAGVPAPASGEVAASASGVETKGDAGAAADCSIGSIADSAVGSAPEASGVGGDALVDTDATSAPDNSTPDKSGPDKGPGPGPILLGGFAFDAGSATGPWEAFGDGRLDLPRVTFGSVGGRTWITINALVTEEVDPAEAAGEVAQALADAEAFTGTAAGIGDAAIGEAAIGCAVTGDAVAGDAAAEAAASAVVTAEDVPPKEQWQEAVRDVAAVIRGGALDKAVLARSTRLSSRHGFDVGAALRYLQAHYPECYVFAVGRGDECFIGATPERIVHKCDGRVQVACMAGSIGRGGTPEEDERLGQWLLADAKNMAEHRVVLRSILEALTPVCTDVVAAPTSLRKLANVQHLYTPVTARVDDDVDVLALVARVHPTPAIGGWPKAEALRLIREKENLDRGWYAGPVGWMDGAGDGEFAVGLRSALVQGDTALLFAGCGIMGDSDPESEYEESVLKLRPMRAALGAGR